MKNTILVVAAAFALVGCTNEAEEACNDYLDALDACYEELGTENPVALSDDYCEAYTEDSQADYLNCLADAYDAGDCSTDDGLIAISTELGSCTL
jgi:hypothetical protein